MQPDFDYAYQYCKEISLKHYENFPVGSLLIPKSKRKFVYSIYAFARTADDIADSDRYSGEQKLRMLEDFDIELSKIENEKLDSLNPETQNIFIALYNTINELKIPAEELRNLLTAFRQDAIKERYNNFNELLEYSKFSADPIGHLVLYVFGYDPLKDKECFHYSDKVCSGLQLANFWQDVSIDLKINRIYIPQKVMQENTYNEKMLFDKIENDSFRKIMKELVDNTRSIFDEGKKILKFVRGRLRFELKATIMGGLEILNKIERINYNVLSTRVEINNFDKLKLAGKLIWK
ncbi:MAG: squalene synthase HpnC [bacterium]